MGIYVNPRNISFEEARRSMIYVDKSGLISYTNRAIRTLEKYICVSRPRRFGKSMAMNMLAAYYSKGCDSRELFTGLVAEQAASFETHLNQHSVIRFDVQHFLESRKDLDSFIGEIERKIKRELLREFSDCTELETEGRLKDSLEQIYDQTGQGFIFLIDEWD